jgi:hypothetical protein
MKVNNIAIVSCSKGKEKTLLSKSVKKLSGHTELYEFKSNKKSICEVYNSFIDANIEYFQDDTAIVFVHDDVYINCRDLHYKIEEGFNTYDVIGVAGTLNAQIKEPCLWHIMGDKQYHRGAAAHPVGREPGSLEPYYITSFGPMPSRALLIDGVFMAVKPKVFKNIRFDETNPARFHYYDLDFSLECNKEQYKIGICDIPIIHMSPGLTNPDEEWAKGQDWFIKKWG